LIKSMTGYGRAGETFGTREVTVEIRSVNNKSLDCTVKMPRAYIFAEESVKACVQRSVTRGKVDVFVSVRSGEKQNVRIDVNRPVLESYLEAFRLMREGYGISDAIPASAFASLPDVLTVTEEEEDLEELKTQITAVTEAALREHAAMRAREGENLFADISGRLKTIEELVSSVEERSPQVVAEYREKLYARLKEVLESTNIDEGRILTEAAIFADKTAVAEETVRLRSHLDQMRTMLESEESVGRKMDFLIQEMNRESNTIGSKGNDIDIARTVVELKSEIEKIREQVQNVE